MPSPLRRAKVQAFIAAHRQAAPVKLLATGASKYLNAFHNFSYDMECNGELFVLRSLQLDEDTSVVFDVGANEGSWSKMVHSLYPAARIHAFEIDPATHAILCENTALIPNITAESSGLADHAGEVTIYSYPDAAPITGMFDYPHRSERVEKAVRVQTGDAYARAHGVDHIDFLKIDVEGAEMLVLEGFDELLSKQMIGTIQFEYGLVNIIARVLLRDLYEFLTAYGYAVGKIYPNRVDFRPYELQDEDFRGPNFLAVPVDRDALIARLSNS